MMAPCLTDTYCCAAQPVTALDALRAKFPWRSLDLIPMKGKAVALGAPNLSRESGGCRKGDRREARTIAEKCTGAGSHGALEHSLGFRGKAACGNSSCCKGGFPSRLDLGTFFDNSIFHIHSVRRLW